MCLHSVPVQPHPVEDVGVVDVDGVVGLVGEDPPLHAVVTTRQIQIRLSFRFTRASPSMSQCVRNRR